MVKFINTYSIQFEKSARLKVWMKATDIKKEKANRAKLKEC